MSYEAKEAALLLVDPHNDFLREGRKSVAFIEEAMHTAQANNGPTYAHVI